MNPKKATEYSIGLDLGTGSVGWALVDQNGDLCHIKNRPTMGSRLFPSADTAATTRSFRSQRRRLQRRRQRILELQKIFCPEIQKVDPDFFNRLNHSACVPEDRNNIRWPLFNNEKEEKNFYKKFPTIYHLRKYLMETSDKADIRWIYLALHNIMKCRGNFLHEGEKISAKTANPDKSVQNLVKALSAYYQGLVDQGLSSEITERFSLSPDSHKIAEKLTEPNKNRSDIASDVAKAFYPDNSKANKWAKKISRACVGSEVEFADIFYDLEPEDGDDGTKFSFADDDTPDAFEQLCSDDDHALYDAIRSVYSAFILHDIVAGQDSLSAAMVTSYEEHKRELACLKRLLKDDNYFPKQNGIYKEYNEFFRGPKNTNGDYDINKLPKESYTAYIAGKQLANKRGCDQQTLVNHLSKDILKINDKKSSNKSEQGASEEDLPEDNISFWWNDDTKPQNNENGLSYAELYQRIVNDDGKFLGKQKTSDNGAIPYQLHEEELEKIIDNQGQFYPFLKENKEHLCKVLSSRIPYYVGPLNTQHDPNGPFPNNKNSSRKFGWSVRKEGQEHTKAYPWNVDEVFDKDKTAENFIRRMLGECTYLYGEEVLPRHSLLYEKFCVLNELNGARVKFSGDSHFHRFDCETKKEIFDHVFRKYKTVSYKKIQRYIAEHMQNGANVQIKGAQKDTGFASKLESWNDFCKILGVDDLHSSQCPLSIDQIEQIILWSTIFEDKSIYKRKLIQLNEKINNVLTEGQINKLAKIRYEGWGRLSKKLLTGIYTQQSDERVEKRPGWKARAYTIMDILENGNPLPGEHNETMLFMEILHNKDFGFEKTIDAINKEKFAEGHKLSIDDLQGSPALRRTVHQAMLVVKELVKVAGNRAPKNICIEVTRDDDVQKRGKRTNSRYTQLQKQYKKLEDDAHEYDPDVAKELNAYKKNKKKLNERLMLYFLQNGKSLYSGTSLDINRLSEYQVDHILPQAFIKDDSLDNKALVLQKENQRKLDDKMIDPTIQCKMKSTWKALKDAGLISEKKYANLTRTTVADRQLIGFVNRQIVETSQVVKFVRLMCEQIYPDTRVVSVRASVSSGVRKRAGLYKSRNLNDFHHAHDAYLACQDVRFLDMILPKWNDGINIKYIRTWLKQQGKDDPKHPYGRSGVVIDRMCNGKKQLNKETGEIWDSELEMEKMRKVVQYKGVFLSRMTEYQTGELWKQTVYSPKDTKKAKPDKKGNVNLVPLKGLGTNNTLDVKKYGGYDNLKQEYFFAFEARDKKGNKKYFFKGVPCYLADSISANPHGLQDYAEGIAQKNGCNHAILLRKCFPLRQKFELNDDQFYMFGSSGNSNYARPAEEITGGLKYAKIMYQIDHFADDSVGKPSSDQCLDLFIWLIRMFDMTNTYASEKLGLSSEDIERKFAELNQKDQCDVIQKIAMYSSAQLRSCNFGKLGEGTSVGELKLNLANKLPNITWIDQSVTGIFERRTTLKDLEVKAIKAQE